MFSAYKYLWKVTTTTEWGPILPFSKEGKSSNFVGLNFGVKGIGLKGRVKFFEGGC